jgi:serine acetyltransferase
LGDLVIGKHAVVGANSVVLKNVASGIVVVGAPARPIR